MFAYLNEKRLSKHLQRLNIPHSDNHFDTHKQAKNHSQTKKEYSCSIVVWINSPIAFSGMTQKIREVAGCIFSALP